MPPPSSRIDAILDGLEPALPVWDLCCDRGVIGCAALDRFPAATVVFVEKRPLIVGALEMAVRSRPGRVGRFRIACDDVLRVDLPSAPVNFVIAGVGTNLICAFLSRIAHRRGDRIVCSTSQSPERFERLARDAGFAVGPRRGVSSRTGQQSIWSVHPA